MKLSLVVAVPAFAIAVLATTTTAWADDAPAAPAAAASEPAAAPDPLSFNLGVVTDYRYRGISQTRKEPALQGGADYADPSGFYVGTWASMIKWIKDEGGNSPVEWDIYGGYKFEVVKDWTLDLGALQYAYINNKLNPSANTTEIYGALSYGVFTAKLSHSLTNLFGFANSKNSNYLDLSAAFDLGDGYSLTPDLAHQRVSHNAVDSYTTYSLTLGKDFGNTWSASAALMGTNTKVYTSPIDGKQLGGTTVVLGVKKTF